eukprot:gene3160-6237_t
MEGNNNNKDFPDIQCFPWLEEVHLEEYTTIFSKNFSSGKFGMLSGKKLSELKIEHFPNLNIMDSRHQKVLMDHIHRYLEFEKEKSNQDIKFLSQLNSTHVQVTTDDTIHKEPSLSTSEYYTKSSHHQLSENENSSSELKLSRDICRPSLKDLGSLPTTSQMKSPLDGLRRKNSLVNLTPITDIKSPIITTKKDISEFLSLSTVSSSSNNTSASTIDSNSLHQIGMTGIGVSDSKLSLTELNSPSRTSKRGLTTSTQMSLSLSLQIPDVGKGGGSDVTTTSTSSRLKISPISTTTTPIRNRNPIVIVDETKRGHRALTHIPIAHAHAHTETGTGMGSGMETHTQKQSESESESEGMIGDTIHSPSQDLSNDNNNLLLRRGISENVIYSSRIRRRWSLNSIDKPSATASSSSARPLKQYNSSRCLSRGDVLQIDIDKIPPDDDVDYCSTTTSTPTPIETKSTNDITTGGEDSSDDISNCIRWLHEINLEQYAPIFLANFSGSKEENLSLKKLSKIRMGHFPSMNISDFNHQNNCTDTGTDSGCGGDNASSSKYNTTEYTQQSHTHTMLMPYTPNIPSMTSTTKRAQSPNVPSRGQSQSQGQSQGPGPTTQSPSPLPSRGIRKSFDKTAWESISKLRSSEKSLRSVDVLRASRGMGIAEVNYTLSLPVDVDVYVDVDDYSGSGSGSGSGSNDGGNRYICILIWSLGSKGNATVEPALTMFSSTPRDRDGTYADTHATPELNRIQNEYIEQFKRVIGCEIGHILFHNERMRELLLLAAERGWYRIPVGCGVEGYCLTTGDSVNVTNPYSDGRFNRNIDDALGKKSRNIICQPVRLNRGGGKIIAVVRMANKNTVSSNASNGGGNGIGIGSNGGSGGGVIVTETGVSFDEQDEETLAMCVQRVAEHLHLGMNILDFVELMERVSVVGKLLIGGGDMTTTTATAVGKRLSRRGSFLDKSESLSSSSSFRQQSKQQGQILELMNNNNDSSNDVNVNGNNNIQNKNAICRTTATTSTFTTMENVRRRRNSLNDCDV